MTEIEITNLNKNFQYTDKDQNKIFEVYNDFTDWPNLTIKLAERGFNEVEIKKMLGLNYLRVFEEVVG